MRGKLVHHKEAMEEQERKPVASLREYLESAREAGGIFRWIWREVTTPQSRRKLYRMFGGLMVVILLQTIQPGAVSYIFNGLTSHNDRLIYWGLGVFFGCMVLQKVMDRYQESAREWVLGLHWGRLDDRITQLFFEKSVGQHIHEGTTLAVSNIDKGRWRLLDMQGMILFEGIPTVLQLLVAYMFLCLLNWVAGVVMGLVIVTTAAKAAPEAARSDSPVGNAAPGLHPATIITTKNAAISTTASTGPRIPNARNSSMGSTR